MHTFLFIVLGLILLWISYLISAHRKVRFLRFFPIVWLVICALHLYYGVMVEEFPLTDELIVHVLNYGIPAACWLGLTQYLRRRPYL